jgi:hypothetical protein
MCFAVVCYCFVVIVECGGYMSLWRGILLWCDGGGFVGLGFILFGVFLFVTIGKISFVWFSMCYEVFLLKPENIFGSMNIMLLSLDY